MNRNELLEMFFDGKCDMLVRKEDYEDFIRTVLKYSPDICYSDGTKFEETRYADLDPFKTEFISYMSGRQRIISIVNTSCAEDISVPVITWETDNEPALETENAEQAKPHLTSMKKAILKGFLDGKYDVVVTESNYREFLEQAVQADHELFVSNNFNISDYEWTGGKGCVFSVVRGQGKRELMHCDIELLSEPNYYNMVFWDSSWDITAEQIRSSCKEKAKVYNDFHFVPAQLHEEELKRKLTACWYDPKYTYYFGGEHRIIQIGDNTDWRRDFVLIDTYGQVHGYFSYNYNECDKSMHNFGLIDFSGHGKALVDAAIGNIRDMFRKGAQRLEVMCFADCPAKKLYDFYISHCGGKQIGTLTRARFFDGRYHDCVIYELLAEDILNEDGAGE